jgi:DNA-binding response OmpR family regulator
VNNYQQNNTMRAEFTFLSLWYAFFQVGKKQGVMGQRILIAEDDPSIQKLFTIILKREGYDIEVFSDGKIIYEKEMLLPNLFILDRQLKNSTDGLEACRYLKSKEATRNIPVIMISATPEIGVLSKKAGAEDYLEKPFSISLLLQKIKKFLPDLRAGS